MRKTIEVSYIVEHGNYFLAHSEDEQRDERKGVASMIELALHKAGAYAGYLHLESAGRYSVNRVGRMYNEFKDDTRRAYMMKGQPYPNTRVEKVAS
jgi:hypothetical protein